MADRAGGGYRDELGAAHARIAELEAQLRERAKLGGGIQLVSRLHAQRTTLDRRMRESHVLTRVAAFGAAVWMVLGLFMQGNERAGLIVPFVVVACAYLTVSSARRETQLKSDRVVLDQNIAEAEWLFARAASQPIRIEVGSATAESTAEPQRSDERGDDHHEHPGRMRAR